MGYPGFSAAQLAHIKTVKTNYAGFRKNEKQNVLIPENGVAIEQIKAQRAQYKTQKSLEDRVFQLEVRLAALERLLNE